VSPAYALRKTMTALLTESEFSQHVNTKFRLNADSGKAIELELVEVASYAFKDNPNERSGMERFSLFFAGPPEPFLPQAIYSLSHDKLGSLDIFLVPIGRNEKGFSYEAVFNYFKDPPGE
jgi:Domain of unknown function (DUF6916)